MSAIPVNDWSIQATVTIAAGTQSAASTALTTALGDISSALATLANGTSFSVNKYPATDPDGEGEINGGSGGYAFDYQDVVNGNFYVEGALLCPSMAQAQAQSEAEAALAAINTAIAGVTPAVTIALENTTEGYVFNLLQ